MINLDELISNNEELGRTLEKSKITRYKFLNKNIKYLEKSKLIRKNNLDMPYKKESMEKSKNKFHLLCNLMKLRTFLSGIDIIEFNSYEKKKSSKPVIFVPTHIGKFDIEVVYECINEHALLLSGTEDRMHGTLNGYFLEKNGVNYVDRSDKNDRKNSVKKMKQDLKNGYNLLWFIEGTWNLSPNQLIYDVSYSVISLALEYDVEIVPIGLNQVDKTIFVNFGKSYKPNPNLTLIESINCLRDKLATLKWELYEYSGAYEKTKISVGQYKLLQKEDKLNNIFCTNRDSLEDDYWAKFVAERVKEWPMTDLQEECNYVFQPKDDAHIFFDEFNSNIKIDKNNKQKIKRI